MNQNRFLIKTVHWQIHSPQPVENSFLMYFAGFHVVVGGVLVFLCGVVDWVGLRWLQV